MKKREIIATILHYADELDNMGYMAESDKLTKIAEDYSEEFDPYIGRENPLGWTDELPRDEQEQYLNSLNLDEEGGGDIGDLPDDELPPIPDEDFLDEDTINFDEKPEKFNLADFKKRLEGAGADIFEEESHPNVDKQEDALRIFDNL
jgi:hypothetical protein